MATWSNTRARLPPRALDRLAVPRLGVLAVEDRLVPPRAAVDAQVPVAVARPQHVVPRPAEQGVVSPARAEPGTPGQRGRTRVDLRVTGVLPAPEVIVAG